MVLNKKFNVPSTYEILETIVQRYKWQNKTPLQKWSFLYGIGQTCCKLIKIPAYQEDLTLHWFAFFPLIYVFIYIIFVYNTAAYQIKQGELANSFPCTCIIGAAVGVSIMKKSNNYVVILQ